ncbi:hypothetical protein F4604DRAFT_1924067 [Suillus subluteus]|nr:hypothetical protein F4604DRAFT_1924067 [Suillus subluteus]
MQNPHEAYNAKDGDVEEDTQSGLFYEGPNHEGYQSHINDDLNVRGSGIQPIYYNSWNPVALIKNDVSYILKTVYSQVLSAGSFKRVERMTDLLNDFMDHDYAGGIKSKLDEVYRMAANTGGGRRGEKSERECHTSFIILLDGLDLSSCMERLTKDLLDHQTITQLFLLRECPFVAYLCLFSFTQTPIINWQGWRLEFSVPIISIFLQCPYQLAIHQTVQLPCSKKILNPILFEIGAFANALAYMNCDEELRVHVTEWLKKVSQCLWVFM